MHLLVGSQRIEVVHYDTIQLLPYKTRLSWYQIQHRFGYKQQHLIKAFCIITDLKKMESKITECFKEDASLHHLFTLITSVVGVGFVTAVNLIIYTQGFNIMCDSRKLACYCGVAPFPYESGVSTKGRTKVSHLANKKSKQIFTWLH